jgi:flavin-dependent dehydrogenase
MRASVERIARDGYNFVLSSTAGDFHARSVVDATGRWSNLRPANAPSAFWVGIKTHFFTSDARENDSVDLYFSPRGYCGVQPVGKGLINVCAMVQSSELGKSR